MKTLKNFKIRASGCGSIMGVRGLGKTGETYVQKWMKEQIYDRRQTFSSKYTQKGNEVEDNSIDFVAEHLGLGMLIKNEDHFENDFMTGTPDLILNDCVIDVKNSWDCFTFPLFDTEIPNNDYFYQGQVYMALTGKTKYKLIYTLLDTPKHLIEKEAYYFANNNGVEFDEELFNEFESKMTYSNIPAEYKIKVFDFEYCQKTVDKIKDRVNECRQIILELC